MPVSYGTAVQVQNLSPAEKEVPPLKKLWTSPFVLFLREAIMLYFSRRVPQAAACLAYFVLLTVFPVLICVSYILGMVNIDIVSLMDQLQPLLPEAALDVLESYLRYISFHQTPGLFLAGLAGCWFSAAAAFRTITRVIIDMYEDVSQSMVRGMVASILFPLGLLVTVDLSVIVVVTGQRTLAAVAQRFPFWDHVLNLWSWTRYVLLFSIFFLFILAVLNMAAPFGTPRLPVLLSSPGLRPGPGGLFCGLLLVYQYVLPVFPGLRLPGLPDHSLIWLYLCRTNSVHRDCVYQRMV